MRYQGHGCIRGEFHTVQLLLNARPRAVQGHLILGEAIPDFVSFKLFNKNGGLFPGKFPAPEQASDNQS